MNKLRCRIAYRLVLLAKWIWPPLLADMVSATIDHLAQEDRP